MLNFQKLAKLRKFFLISLFVCNTIEIDTMLQNFSYLKTLFEQDCYCIIWLKIKWNINSSSVISNCYLFTIGVKIL